MQYFEQRLQLKHDKCLEALGVKAKWGKLKEIENNLAVCSRSEN